MAKLVKPTHLIDVNFVIPESQVKTLAKFQFLIGPLVGVGLLAAAATMHLGNTSEAARLSKDIQTLQQQMQESIAADTEDYVGTHRALSRERDDLSETLSVWREVIPEANDWPARYADLLDRLPGIGQASPSITLSTLNAATTPGRKREDYGIPTSTYERIDAEFTIAGIAKTKEDVTQAAISFQNSPNYVTIFTGTSATSTGYSFNLTVGHLSDPPQEATDQEGGITP